MGLVNQQKKYLFYCCGDRNKASSRVRGYWIAEALREDGMKCSIESCHSKVALLWFGLQVLFHDVIIFQKVYSRYHYWLLRWAAFCRRKTIIDLDDAPSRTKNSKTLETVEAMMRHASAVTVGSQALFDYAEQFSNKVRLVPSSIYLKYYQPHEKQTLADEPICLGWIGNGRHYKQDLIEILTLPLTAIAQHRPIKLKLVGACSEPSLYSTFAEIPGLALDFIDQIEWSNPHAVSEVLQDIDIGLYPLLTNDFNQYKCGFKALEYMAMAVPVVSSDVSENREIVEHGKTGLFARTSKDWVQQLEYLLKNKTARMNMGVKGRAKVVDRYNVDCAAKAISHLV